MMVEIDDEESLFVTMELRIFFEQNSLEFTSVLGTLDLDAPAGPLGAEGRGLGRQHAPGSYRVD